MNIKLRSFESQILYFNGMYKLPVAAYPTTWNVIQDEKKKFEKKGIAATPDDKDFVIKRVTDFRKTLMDEVNEADDIIQWLKLGKKLVKDKDGNESYIEYTEIEFLVDMSDWLNDVIVYCSSEQAKFGLPSQDILAIIMSSNFSKLGPDGEVILDDAGKVLKGPLYWKPEPRIKELLQEKITDAQPWREGKTEIVWR